MEHNIPQKKIQAKIASIVGACNTCSKRTITSDDDVLDGLCKDCALKIKMVNRLINGNVPISYWSLTMEKDFVGDPRLLEKYNSLANDIDGMYNNGKSMLLAGSFGLGKTMTSCCLLKKAAMKGYSIWYSTLSDIVMSLTNYEQQYETKMKLSSTDFLVIDEFDGRYVSTEQGSNLFARSLESVLRTRIANQQPTILCTNSPNIIESLSGTLKEALGSLFAGHVETFITLGEDVRKTN